MKPLSVAILSIHSSPLGTLGTRNTGGMSVVISETARELGALGHRIDIFTSAANGDEPDVIPMGKNVRLILLNGGLNGQIAKSEMLRHLPKFNRALVAFTKSQRINYDLLHSHYWLSGRLGMWAQNRWGIPHAITYHTLGWLKNRFETGPEESSLRIAWECRLARTTHKVLVATGKERADLVERCRIEDSRVGVVPFGVDTETFAIKTPNGSIEPLGLRPDESLILFVGRFVRLKGIERLLEAVALLNASRKIRLLLIGGDGPQSDSTRKLKALAARLGIAQRVIFKDPIAHDQLVDYYNAADVLALPAYYESFGLVVLESLACGTPVVATPVGVAPSVIREGKNGELVREPGAEFLSSALSNVLQGVARGRIHAGKVRASVLKYHWPGVAKALQKEYFSLTRARASAALKRRTERIRHCCGICRLDPA